MRGICGQGQGPQLWPQAGPLPLWGPPPEASCFLQGPRLRPTTLSSYPGSSLELGLPGMLGCWEVVRSTPPKRVLPVQAALVVFPSGRGGGSLALPPTVPTEPMFLA